MHKRTRPAWVATAALPAVFATTSIAAEEPSLPTLATLEAHAREPAKVDDARAARLAQHVALDDVLALVHAQSPTLRAARARVRSALSSVKSASRLPDPALKAEIWGAPLLKPYALNEADTLMLGIKQELPLADLVDSKRDVAAAEATMQSASLLTDELDAERDVRAAYVRYRLAFEERALHEQHIKITEATIDALRAAQAAGHANEADVSTAQAALAMAHTDLFTLDADETSARATLNAWMARAPDAPVGAPDDDDAASSPAATTLASSDTVFRARAEQAAADAMARATNDDATLPTFMAGFDYWYMPARPDPHAYGAMLSVSLPWLNFGRAGDVEAAAQKSNAARATLEATKLDVERMRVEASARVDADRRRLHAADDDEIPAVEHNVEATKSAFAAGATDARAVLAANAMLLDARIRRARLRAELALATLDLSRITGHFDGNAR